MTDIQFIENHFRSLTKEQRQQRKKDYEHLIAVENDEIPAVKNLRTGKMYREHKMPWMLSAWKNGLDILNRIINELDN